MELQQKNPILFQPNFCMEKLRGGNCFCLLPETVRAGKSSHHLLPAVSQTGLEKGLGRLVSQIHSPPLPCGLGGEESSSCFFLHLPPCKHCLVRGKSWGLCPSAASALLPETRSRVEVPLFITQTPIYGRCGESFTQCSTPPRDQEEYSRHWFPHLPQNGISPVLGRCKKQGRSGWPQAESLYTPPPSPRKTSTSTSEHLFMAKFLWHQPFQLQSIS